VCVCARGKQRTTTARCPMLYGFLLSFSSFGSLPPLPPPPFYSPCLLAFCGFVTLRLLFHTPTPPHFAKALFVLYVIPILASKAWKHSSSTHLPPPPSRQQHAFSGGVRYWKSGIWIVEALHVPSLSTAGGHWMRKAGALVLSSLDQQVYTAYFLGGFWGLYCC
jgi:hypothetical protein